MSPSLDGRNIDDAATAQANPLNQITNRVGTGGGKVGVAGFISETGTVAIAGNPAQMLTTTQRDGTVRNRIRPLRRNSGSWFSE
jgi:hypothetical protein